MSDPARPRGRWRVLVPEFALAEFADDLGVDPDHIRNAINSGAVTPAKVALRTPMFCVEEILTVLKEQSK